MTKARELHVAVAKECNSATTDPYNATANATPVQRGRLKCLANKVLERNSHCNNDATIAQSECNNLPLKDAEKLHTNSKPERCSSKLIERVSDACAGLDMTPEKFIRILNSEGKAQIISGELSASTLKDYAKQIDDAINNGVVNLIMERINRCG